MRAIGALLVLGVLCGADVSPLRDEPEPYPYVTTSPGRGCYFKLVPESENRGSGRAYRVTAAEADELLWSVSGWFTWETYLSRDGRYLVRLEDAADPKLMAAFYDSGKLLAEYRIEDLIEQPDKVPVLSHGSLLFFRQGAHAPQFTAAERFTFTTAELVEYTFDIRTGEVVKQESYRK
ncbi:MAG TPA: hypothetical protein VFD43_02990 [Planctomycetota bacterium]|nr:hypothetical protein [Planctomycetota bacterium]